MAIVCEPLQVSTTDGTKSFFGLSTVSDTLVSGTFETYATQRGYTEGILDLTATINAMSSGESQTVLTLTNGSYVTLEKVSNTPFYVKIRFYDKNNTALNLLGRFYEDDGYRTINKFLYGFCKNDENNHIGSIAVVNADQYNGTKTNIFFGNTEQMQLEQDAQYQTFLSGAIPEFTPCVKIKWTDPPDIATNEPVPCNWAGTVVVKKSGSAPLHKWDGTILVDSTTRDEYSVNPLIDEDIEQYATYYYGIFPYYVAKDDPNNPIKYYRFTKVVSIKVGELPEPPRRTWAEKVWNGFNNIIGQLIWTDGTNIYYSNGSSQYVLDKATSTWSAKTWNGLTDFYGYNIWTDGTNIYFSKNTNPGSGQYVLDKATSTWTAKTWNGFNNLSAGNVWTDGENIYYSEYSRQYVLDKATSTWTAKTWNGFTSFAGSSIWTDGTNIYYSNSSDQYVLDKATSTWSAKTWNGLTSFSGAYVWTDGTNIYYSNSSDQYVLDKATSTWSAMTWDSPTQLLYGMNVWTDGTNIYYSNGSEEFVLT